uniref:Transmembrane protein 104 n=1 Tax=Neogobius melanostomus TaxID=47308 RepID=A0A8C6S5U3_9GOBI
MAGGITETGEPYSAFVGLIYMFNLIVGTGALTMPKAFATAGWVVSIALISFLGFMSYMTTTFVIEAMAAANAQLRWKRRELEETDESDSTSDYSDDEVITRGRAEPETKPILSIQRSGGHGGQADHFDIVERVEMGQMASMFFNKVGVNMFYICLIVYLYGDLAIYAAAVPISLMEVACGNHSCSSGSVKYSDTDPCWGPVTRKDAYRVFLFKMYWSLQMSLLISLCSLSMGRRRAHHCFTEKKTWKDAQTYCKTHYTDLATLHSKAHVKCICPNESGCRDAWIGLYNKRNYVSDSKCNSQRETHWLWSQPGQVYRREDAKWKDDEEPGGHADCVYAQKKDVKLSLNVQSCNTKYVGICYDDEKKQKYFEYESTKTWLQAQQYCREKHTDLLSGSDQLNDLKHGSNFEGTRWIGLFRDAWDWSDGSNSSFRNWKDNNDPNKFDCHENRCAKLGDNWWEIVDCTEPHPFICYDDHMVLVKENKTWEEALIHCRRNYGELAMMTDEHEQTKVLAKAKMADTDHVWVGLHFSCFFDEWMWVNGHWVSSDDKNWGKRKERPDCNVSGAMQKKGTDKWVKRPSEDRYNFVCAVHCRPNKN